MSYGSVGMSPIIYQDDLARLATSVVSIQAGIKKVEACMETKLLDLHEDKSWYILFGKGKKMKELKDDLKSTPLTLYGKPIAILALILMVIVDTLVPWQRTQADRTNFRLAEDMFSFEKEKGK